MNKAIGLQWLQPLARLRHDRPLNGERVATAETATISILLVEDNDVEREGLATILRRQGFVIREAETGDQALNGLRAETPDLVLLDMLLPGQDGWSILEQVRHSSDWSGIPVLIVTGLGVASPEWARSLGAVDVVRKPINTEELLQKIRRHDRG